MQVEDVPVGKFERATAYVIYSVLRLRKAEDSRQDVGNLKQNANSFIESTSRFQHGLAV